MLRVEKAALEALHAGTKQDYTAATEKAAALAAELAQAGVSRTPDHFRHCLV